MKKISVLLYSLSLMGISFYGFSSHSYYVQLFINLGRPYLFVRTAFALALTIYAFIPWLRVYVTKALFGLGGLVLLSLGLVSVYSPNLLGHINGWMLLGDDLMLIEGGILAIVLSAELSIRRTELLTSSLINMRLLMATRSRKLTYSSHLQPAKILKIQSYLAKLY